MNKIRIISMILAVITIVTACNLGMMFTSFADVTIEISNADDLYALSEQINPNSGTVSINLTKNIDASSIGAIESIDATDTVIVFNGGGLLISNLNLVGGGLFTNVASGSSFKNLGLYNCTISDFAADSGKAYGFLAGHMPAGSVENCFVDGTITVYGKPKNVGGLIGKFGGAMTHCFAMTDIYTDGSYVGGLIGEFTGTDTTITACYSTGSIDNDGYDHIGGLIGYSPVPCVTNSYTTTCILNPYTDTIKSIGVINGLSADHDVYYDSNLSLQKQGDIDPHRCTPSELRDNFRSIDDWVIVDREGDAGEGCYPQLAVFYNNNRESFKRISAISSAVVDIDRSDGVTTGREFTVLSTATHYSFAVLTNTTDVTDQNHNRFMWRIAGGIDEYYFDYGNITEAKFPTNSGSVIDGLSGTSYDDKTGKYLFVNTGDIKFTASSGIYERDIYVHVTTYDKHPYFPEAKVANIGRGTQDEPFIINSFEDFDTIRLYCLDNNASRYYYQLKFGTGVSSNIIDFNNKDWLPIVGMKGTLIGNGHNILNLNVTRANEGAAGLFATISYNATISDLHLSNSVISPEGGCDKAGLLAGSVNNANISNVLATGRVSGAVNGGMMAGEAYGTTTVSTSITYGLVSSSGNVGGMFGTTEDNVKSIDCLSSAVVADGKSVGGFYGYGHGDVESCLFVGNLAPGLEGVRHGLIVSGNVDRSYYDWQAAGVHNAVHEYAKDTATLITENGVELSSKWVWSAIGTDKTKHSHYPRLSAFDSNSDPYTKRSSFLASYSFQYFEGSEKGSSLSFDRVTVNRKYEFNSNRTISELSPYGGVTGSYAIPEMDEDSPASKPITYDIGVVDGGRQIYSFANGYSDYPCDTRYVLFNVRSINVRYKFTFASDEDKTAYCTDMSNKGLAYIVSDLGARYGAILDSSITDNYDGVITISPAGDSLSFDMINADKYISSIEAYVKDGTDYIPISVQIGNTISIASLEDVYVNFVIDTPELPWGIYRVDCN